MTLDSHEIRLGNTYKIELGDGTYKTDLINLADIQNLLDDGLDDYYQALEITDEWLEKIGFKCIFTYDDHHYYNGFLALDRDFQPFDYNITYEIKYAHQLENLYFALTGQELTYNC